MISGALRRFSMATPPLSTLMESSSASQRLRALAQQLRLYKPPPSPPSSDDEEEEEQRQESARKVVSQLGFAESAAPIPHPPKFTPKRAAVLICLFEGDAGDLRVILTKRSRNLSTHSGEVALPGGKAEEGDVDDRATAMREAKEEIGLDPSLVAVVTVIEPFLSKVTGDVLKDLPSPRKNQGYGCRAVTLNNGKLVTIPPKCYILILQHLLRVTPVIGILSDYKAFKPVLSTSEVEEIFDAPLEMFLKDENRRSEQREWMGTKYLVHFFDFEEENKKYMIWGLTAGILIRAASVVFQRPPLFEEQKPISKIRGSTTRGDTMP